MNSQKTPTYKKDKYGNVLVVLTDRNPRFPYVKNIRTGKCFTISRANLKDISEAELKGIVPEEGKMPMND